MPAGNRDEIRQQQQSQAQHPGGYSIPTGASAGNGSGIPANFKNLYRDLAQRQQQQQQQERENRANKREEATIFDKMAKRVIDIGQGAMNIGQDFFADQRSKGNLLENPVGNLVGLAATLPGGIVGAPIYGAGEVYETSTGRDIQSMEDGTISAERLSGSQRAWEGLDALVNIGGGPVGASGRILGDVGKGIAKTGTKAGDVIGKLMPNEGRGLVSKGLEKAGASKGVQIGGQVAADMAEEGVEEFVQTWAEHGRAGDEFTGDTMNEAIESAGWGALGGAMMSGAGLAINHKMGPLNKDKQIDAATPDDSGFARMGEIKNKVSTREVAPTAKMAYDTEVTRPATEQSGALGLTVASNPAGIGLDDGWVGIDGYRAAWRAADENGRKNLSEMLHLDAETIESALADTDISRSLDILNQNLGGHFDYNMRAIKREPGTSGTTIHNIYVTRIVAGARMQLHPMTSQLGNGDIDGDVKTLLHLPNHNYMLPSQLFLNPDGTSTDFGLEYLPDLDTDTSREVFKNQLRDKLGWLGSSVGDDYMNSMIDRLTESASRAKRDADKVYDGSYKRDLMFQMNELANQAAAASGNPNIASDLVGNVLEAMYDSVADTESFEALMTRDIKLVEDDLDQNMPAQVSMGELEGRRVSSGNVGNAKTQAAIAHSLDMITSLLVGRKKGSIMRNGQAIKYGIASKVEKFTELDAVMRDAGTDSIERFLANTMKLVNIGEHINENVTSLFNNFVLIRFMSEVGLSENNRMGSDNALDPDVVLDKFIEVRNDLAEQFNKAVEKEFHSGLKDIVGSVEKITLDKKNDRDLAYGYMLQTIENFDLEDFFKIPPESRGYGMTIGDAVRLMAHDNMTNSLIGHVGSKAARLLNSMVKYERGSYDRTFNGILDDFKALPRLNENDLSTEQGYITGTLKLETLIHIMDPVVSLDQNLYEVYDVADSEYGWSVFQGNAEDLANVAVSASLRTAYKGVIEAYERYEESGNENDLEYAVALAGQLRGDSALSKSIYAELRENGSIKQIRFLTDMRNSYDDKVHAFKTAADRKGVMFENLLVSALTITQPDVDVITSRIRENKKTISQISEEAMAAAREEGRAIVNYLRNIETDAEKMNAMDVLADFCKRDKYMINDELFVSVISDSTNIHLHDNEKGTTIDSALMFYQQMEMFVHGGPTSLSAEMQSRSINSMSVEDFMSNKLAWIDVLFNGKSIYLTSGRGADPEPINLDRILRGAGVEGGAHGTNGTMSINDFAALVEACPQIIRLLEPHSITPSLNRNEDGGVGQTGSERSLGSFTRRFQSYMENRVDGVESIIERQEKADIEKLLLNMKQFPVLFAASLNINQDGTVGREEIIRRKNEIVDDVYQILGYYSDGDEEIVEQMVVESVASHMGSAIVGPGNYTDLAKKIASGEVSLLFSPNFLFNRMCREMKSELINDQVSNLDDVIFDDDGNIINGEDVIEGLKIITMNYQSIANTMHADVDPVIDQINSAAFAMIGRERMAKILENNLRTTMGFSRLSPEYQSIVDEYVNKAVNEVCDELMKTNLIEESDILLEGIDDSQLDSKREEMWAKMLSIIDDPKYGASNETKEAIESNFNKAWSENGKKRQDMLEQVRQAVDNLVLASGVNEITSYTGSSVNEFFMEDAFTLGNSFKEMIGELREQMVKDGMHVTQHRQYRDTRKIYIPSFNLTDPKNAFVALMSGRHVSEGQIGTNVGVNGYVLGNMYGLSLLSHYNSCNAESADPVPASEFVLRDHIGEGALIKVGDEERFTVLTDYTKIHKDATISVYDRSQCTCPMCKNHYGATPNRFSKGYLRTTASYFDLLCWAQEQKNLKLKKALEIVGSVVPKTAHDELMREDIEVASSEQADVFDAAKQCSDKMREELVSRYTKVLDSYGAMDDIDASVPESIAAMNSSVVIVTGVDGTISYASLYELNDEKMFAKIRGKVGGDIAKVRSFPISFEQLNAKIEGEIMEGLKGKESFSTHDTEKISWKAASEWRNYETTARSVNYMLARLPLYQVGGQTNVIPSGHYTAEQMLRGQVNADGTIKKRFARRKTSADTATSDIIKNNLKYQFGKKSESELEFLITDVEIDPDYRMDHIDTRNMDLMRDMERAFHDNPDKFFNGWKSATIIANNNLGRDDIRKMISEGYLGYDYVIVPKKSIAGMSLTNYSDVKIWGSDFVALNIEAEHDTYSAMNDLTYGEGYFDVKMVGVAYYDAIGYYGQGDGSIIISKGWADNVKSYHVDDIRVNLDLLKNKSFYSYRVVSRDQLSAVCKKILNDEAVCYYPTIERINDVKEDANKWFQSIVDGTLNESTFSEDGYTKLDVERNTPFAIIARPDGAGGEIYMPAYATGEIPEVIGEISGYSFDQSTGEFRFHQQTELGFDDAVDLKGTQSLEASKGKIRTHVQGSDPEMPVIAKQLNTNRVAVFNQNTRIGRIIGSSEKLLKESIFLLSKSMPSNFAFIVDGSGGISINPKLNYDETGTNPEMLSADDIDTLMRDYNDETLLRQIAGGTKKVFKDEHASLVVRRLASECLNGNEVTLSNLLCPFECSISFSELVSNPSVGPEAVMYCKPVAPRQISGVFRRFSFVDMKSLYSNMNGEICPDPFAKDGDVRTDTVMDNEGNMLMTVNGKTGYYPARLSYITFMSEDSRIGERQVNSSFSMQQKIGYGLRNGVAPSDINDIVDAIKVKNADLSGYAERRDNTIKDIAYSEMLDYDPRQNLIDIDWLGGYGVDRYLEQVKAQEETWKPGRLKIREADNILDNPMKNDRFKNAFNKFKSAIKGDDQYVSVDLFLDVVVKPAYGWSYSDGDGNLSIPVDFVASATQEWITNLKGDSQYLIEGRVNGTSEKSRISFGMIPRNKAEQLWEVSEVVRQKFGNMGEFFDSMNAQQENTLKEISRLTTTNRGSEAAARIAKKRDALWLLNAYIQRTWGVDVPTSALYSNVVSQDYEDSLRMVQTGLFDTTTEEVEKMIQQSKDARRQSIAAAQRANKRGRVEVSVSDQPGGIISVEKGHRKNPVQRAMDGSVSLMRVMAVLDPAVLAGNFLEGNIRGLAQDVATSLPGTFLPWGKDKRTFNGEKDNVLRAISERQDLQQLLKVMRETSLRGDLDAFILGLSAEGETIESVCEKLYGDQRWYSKWADRIFSGVSMDTHFLQQQTYRMLKFLDTYITQGDYPALMRKDTNGNTQFEVSLETDPVNFFKNMLAVDSPVRTEVLRAVNTSDTFSMAQRNAVSIVFENVTKKSSVANFITATTLTPFIRYNTNIAGRVLNWFMPISSMNYVMINQLSQFDSFKDMGIEQAQIYDSMKSALIVDASHMGFTAVAAIIIALGLLDYPDDEDKWGNYGEYLFMGHRINEDYVLDDLTGPIFPYACFMKTVLDGKPRLDILFNGITEVSAKNPLMKVGEVIDVVLSPDQVYENMEDQAMSYEDTLAGKPDFPDIARGTMEASVLSFLGKAFVPSFIRNIGAAYDYERSYKRVWAPNGENVDVSAGKLTDTVRVDYDEAMIRKVTRDNVVLGVIMNFITNADTSYTGATSLGAKREMTPVVYSDPYQRYIMDQYSIYYKDDKGEYVEKSENEKQAIALDIIATMQQYNNMEDLYDQGFILDSRTRRYVGDIIWQTVGEIQATYWNWANSEDADAYVLGGGDFQTGMSIKQDAYNAMSQSVQYWKDFYYNKLNSEPMKRGLQKYLRENVTYWQDDNGDYYASGFNKGMNLWNYLTGTKVAPGTLTDDQGTMGYEGDWATPSAVVDGMSTYERALHPIDQEIEETVPFDDLAKNHPELADTIEKAKNGTSSSNGTGGRGYGRSGGGGGGGGSKTIYSHPGSVNVPTARTISASRPYDSKLDYLRPGFETKGSREASRRSDF